MDTVVYDKLVDALRTARKRADEQHHLYGWEVACDEITLSLLEPGDEAQRFVVDTGRLTLKELRIFTDIARYSKWPTPCEDAYGCS